MSSITAFTQYDALPGHKLGFKDKQVKLPRQSVEPVTESILFIGTAADGPVNQPISVTPENVYQIFGKATNANGASNGTNLVPAFEEAWLAGCRDIRLMRYSGKIATAQLIATTRKESNVNIKVDEFFAGGNKNTEFAVENLDIDTTTLLVFANGVAVSPTFINVSELADRTVFTIADDTVDAGAAINLSYSYLEVDAVTGNTDIVAVVDRNYDFDGNPIVAAGALLEADLTQVPQGTVRVYVGDTEVTLPGVFDVAGKKFTFDQTKYTATRGTAIKVSYSFVEFTDVTPVINIASVNAGSNYNNFATQVEKDALGVVTVTITKPEDKKTMSMELPLKFRSVEFPNLALLANAINNHPYNGGLIEATVEPEFQSVATTELIEADVARFAGGSDENNLSPDEIYTLLGGERDADGYVVTLGAYQTIENYTVDYVIPLGIYADDKLIGLNDNFAYQLALACAVMSHYNSVTMGLISTTAPRSTNLRDIEDHVRKLEVLPNSFLMKDVNNQIITDADGNPIDLGQFIGIVAGPEVITINTSLGYLANNTPASIAGLISALEISSAPTNKVVPGAQGLRYELSASQLGRLVGARYITLRKKSDGAITVVDAMTAAQPDSDYTRVSTARVIKEVANQVRLIADPYIGEPNDVPNRNALAASLDKRLGKLVDAGVITSYTFDIIATAQMELMGESQVQLSVKVPNELRKISTIVGLTA